MRLKPLLQSLLFLFTIARVYSIRCQCSISGPAPCYKNWCEINTQNGKEAACALVQTGHIRNLACVRVKKDSVDGCKVDRVDGKLQVRCWCRGSDYCNVDLAERVEEEQTAETAISAEEIQTTTTSRIVPSLAKDVFTIDAAYEVDDPNVMGVSYDDDDYSIEADFPLIQSPVTTPPTLPPKRIVTPDPSIPHWRREYPVPEPDDLPPPPRTPPRPAETNGNWPAKIPERVTERITAATMDPRRAEWYEMERRRQQERREPPRQPPATSTTTTTTTTTLPPTTTSTITTTSRRPTTTSTSTTTTTTPTTTPTTRKPTTMTTTTASTTPTTTTSTESVIDHYIHLRENQEMAKRLYNQHKNRYRPYDLLAPKNTTSTSTTSTTSLTTTKEPSTTRRTTTTTKRSTERTTTTRRTTTVEEGEREDFSEGEPLVSVYGSSDEDLPKRSSASKILLAILFFGLSFVF